MRAEAAAIEQLMYELAWSNQYCQDLEAHLRLAERKELETRKRELDLREAMLAGSPGVWARHKEAEPSPWSYERKFSPMFKENMDILAYFANFQRVYSKLEVLPKHYMTILRTQLSGKFADLAGTLPTEKLGISTISKP